MKNHLISVIVPIYNTALYLTECLEALQNQTYRNLEIILINDGSTDTSAAICKRFCDMDTRFVLVEQSNQGLGPTRNLGIEKSSGEFVCMVDSDDVVDSCYIEILYDNLIKWNADISMGNYLRFNDIVPEVGKTEDAVKEMSFNELVKDISTTGPNNRSEKIVVCWNKLYRKELWKGIQFPNKLHEDEFVILDLLMRAGKIVYTENIIYFYRQRPESIMGQNSSKDIRHLSLLEAIYRRVQRLNGKEYKELFPDVLVSYFDNAIILYFTLLAEYNKGFIKYRIFPPYVMLLCRYMHRLSLKKVLKYGMFLILPNYFKRRYWQ